MAQLSVMTNADEKLVADLHEFVQTELAKGQVTMLACLSAVNLVARNLERQIGAAMAAREMRKPHIAVAGAGAIPPIAAPS